GIRVDQVGGRIDRVGVDVVLVAEVDAAGQRSSAAKARRVLDTETVLQFRSEWRGHVQRYRRGRINARVLEIQRTEGGIDDPVVEIEFGFQLEARDVGIAGIRRLEAGRPEERRERHFTLVLAELDVRI